MAGSSRSRTTPAPDADLGAEIVPTPRSVLVVDDDQDIREILSEVLSEAGYAVMTASNGEVALDVLKRQRPSLILLDLNMPVMDGIEFRRHQRHDPFTAGIPIVVMSAVNRMGERLADLSVDGALEKPVKLDELLRVVSRFAL